MNNTKQSSAIYFKSLKLNNIRCFGESQTLDLSNDGIPSQWTLILGNNGVGKTTLLQCLAWMRPVPSVGEENKITGVTPALQDEENTVFEKLLRNHQKGESLISAKLTQGIYFTDFNRLSVKPDEIYTQSYFCGESDGKLKETHSEGTDKGEHKLPLVISYGANRLQGKSYLDINHKNYDPAKNLVGSTELIDVEDWLTAMDYAVSKSGKRNKKEKEQLNKVKKILAEILPDLSGKNPIKIFGPNLPGVEGPSGVHVKTPYGTVPISALSLGYRTTMGWTVDLAFRLYVAYPDSLNPLSEPAIVLIDEIDLHLHPMWQRQIIKNLSNHFPNTQFIVTAHSPLMVQSANNANLVVLITEGNHVRIENSPEFLDGWRVDQILTSDLFGLPSARSEKVEKLINERQKLLESERTSEEESRLIELEQEIEKLPSLENIKDQEALDFIKRAAEALKK
ncbi:AAA family ATPase [Methylomonas sp. MO1]|uniref:AAA family ATPase n=1 Tax=Methylomonas sp. MO1 TaxID=3073619 RepID=UPI0028A545EF|nr:AAA family ATPase [Methylomonas sp. MO1]MDT4292348.1 AAA family ATPase [Methylomonas sp. MO1]